MLTIIITLGISLQSMIIVSLPTSILMLYVCIELLLAQLAMAVHMPAPFRFSSVAPGELIRPGVYIIAEDVVAVDGKQGQAFRQAWSDRYEASPAFRALLRRLDLLWGSTGLAIVAAIWGLVFGVANHEIGYTVGESSSLRSFGVSR